MADLTMGFCTAVNCMDGRVQEPVVEFMQRRFGVPYVDVVTEPGPNLVLAEPSHPGLVASILRRVGISVHSHGSRGIAIVGHNDCAGNPADKEAQMEHLRVARGVLVDAFPSVPVLMLWAEIDGDVEEL